jgi:hypothetical protein
MGGRGDFGVVALDAEVVVGTGTTGVVPTVTFHPQVVLTAKS